MKYPNAFILLSLIIKSLLLNYSSSQETSSDEVTICGGFIEFDPSFSSKLKNEIDYSSIIVRSYTSDNIMKEQTNVAQSGYYFLPVYEQETIIVRISAPYGMTFEPDHFVHEVNDERSIEQACKEDSNFKFVGYRIEGQISTFGSADGPEGVKISLFSNENDIQKKLQETVTLDHGKFKFNPAHPGKYVLKPTNPEDNDIFDPNHLTLNFEVKINSENYLDKALIIRGYKVSGSVQVNNTPLEGISALIYAFDEALTSDYKCKSKAALLKGSKLQDFTIDGLVPFCITSTDKEGNFLFSNIPYGKFIIKPFYNLKNVSYEIFPSKQIIEVSHKDFTIEEKFEVINLSISGAVVNNKGKGIPNVTIKIDGEAKSVTDKNGIYFLEKLVPGNYDLEAQTEHMFFEPLTNVEISPNSKFIPNFIVKDFKLCGVIHIEANEYISTAKRTVVLKEIESKKERRTVTDNQGRYCFEVKPGKYHIYPFLTQEEKEMELHLNPESIDIEIVDDPILDVNFYQSKVEVSGTIKCIEDCKEDMKVYLSSFKTEKVISTALQKINGEFHFKFSNILSGQYKVFIKKLELCWDHEEIQLKVQNLKINNLSFVQVGFSLFYNSQYDIDVDIKSQTDPELKLKSVLRKNESKICLPKEGEFNIYPKSCHKFPQEFYPYSTSNVERLQITPTEFLVKGSLELQSKVFQSMKNNLQDLSVDILIEEISSDSISEYKTIKAIATPKKQNDFSFYTKSKVLLLVTPEIKSNGNKESEATISKLLFYPKFRQIKIEENCSENAENLKFEMRSGHIIEGQITPPMEGVKITAYNKENNEIIAQTESLPNGQYKIGPLYTEIKNEIKAFKDGYKIIVSPSSPYNFNAEKLSFLRVRIVDQNKKPLSSVFISLSSADRGFKLNNNTNAEGYFDFYELYSGDYYIKPLLKEYRFEPAQKLVKIVGGEHYEETIVANRVAFSVFGKSKFN